jgi:hypothetical protein
MLVLKPLDQAIKDNDTVRAIIVGTGLNQDGKTPGITMPNGAAQGKRHTLARYDKGMLAHLLSRGSYEAGLRQRGTRPQCMWVC